MVSDPKSRRKTKRDKKAKSRYNKYKIGGHNRTMKDKKAQQLSITTLILIVLGVLILVFIILGISLGFGNLMDKINVFSRTDSLADIVLACRIDAQANDRVSYCQSQRPMKIGDVKENIPCVDKRVQDLLEQAYRERQVNCGGIPAYEAPSP